MNNETALESTEVTTKTNLFKLFDATNTEWLTDYNRTYLNSWKVDFYADNEDENRLWMAVENIDQNSKGSRLVLFLNASELIDRVNELDYSDFNNNDGAYSQEILDIACEFSKKANFYQGENQRKARKGAFSF